MAHAHRIRVVVADDDPAFLALLRLMLDLDDRLEVVGEAADGEEAVRMAGELEPDVVAMDIVMPGLDGIGATAAIHASLPSCRVVLISGTIFQRDPDVGVEVAIDAGASAYVPKARAVLELANTLCTVARSGVADTGSPAK